MMNDPRLEIGFDPSPAISAFAEVLDREQLDAIANRCAFASMTYRDGGLVCADLIVAAGEARDADPSSPVAFAYLAVAEELAGSLLAAWGT